MSRDRRATFRRVALLVVGCASSAMAQSSPPPLPPPAAAPTPPPLPPPSAAPPAAPPASPPPPVYQPLPTWAPPPDAYGPAVPPPLVRGNPGAHLHDGFYLRLAIGVAAHRSDVSLPAPPRASTVALPNAPSSQRLSGGAAEIDVAIGGSLGRGFVLAGDFAAHSVASPKTDASDASAELADVSFSTLMLLGDWYVVPTAGWHVQAGLGLGSFGYRRVFGPDGDERNLGGFAWGVGAGWEGWVGEEWGIGALLRIDGGSMRRDDPYGTGGVATAKVLAPSLLFSATFN